MMDEGLSPDRTRRDAADEQLIETLLTSALRPDVSARETRINRVMMTIRETTSDQMPAANAPRPRGRAPRIPRRWMPLTLAAAILFVLFWWLQSSDPGQRAHATVQRSLLAARHAMCRLYRVTTTARRPLVGTREAECQLYVDGEQRFALRHPSLLLPGELWLGSNGQEPWIVPPRGPVLVGNPGMIERWTEQHRDVTAPVLHVTTILERMVNHYDLEMLPAEVLSGVERMPAAPCDRVRGTRRGDSPQLPLTVELWADTASGVARQLILAWDSGPNAMGLQRAQVELIEEPIVPDDWFDHRGHHAVGRPVVRTKFENPVPGDAAADNSN